MGCDIHSFAEKRNKETGKWEKVNDAFTLDSYDKAIMKKNKGSHPFDWRSYSVFAFLAGVRNYDCCEPLSEPKGMPSGVCEEIKSEYDRWEGDAHSASYFTAKELSDFDYNKTFWNRRISRTIYREDGSVAGSNGACLANEGEGEIVSYRDNLGEFFFVHLEELKSLGEPEDVRIVFWFDN